jgi:two-component system, OmpR family, KDP operon response regulator KdpE
VSAGAVRVLVVDDEPPIRKLLRTGLASQGYEVIEAGNGRAAQAHLSAEPPPDLMILDLGLPDLSGQELLRRLRSEGSAIPVIILSSRTDETGIVEALELGADDYVTKPFGMKELVARIRTALRHRLQTQGEHAIFQSGDLSVDLVRRIVRVRGAEVKLTPREYEILRLMVQHAGKVLTHQFIIRQVWGGGADVQNLRVHVRQLRQKLAPDDDLPRHIHTETGVGYRLLVAD